MVDFWSTLTELIKQYTVADTANVFTIVGGIATVIAAVGAIIAVVVTRKIANEQINIANKQNEISEMQAGIAKQQNNIALLNQRMVTLHDLENFFREWEMIYYIFQASDVKNHSLLCKTTLFNRSCVKRKKIMKEMNMLDYIALQSDQIEYDTKMFDSIPYLFDLSEEFESLIAKLKANYIYLTCLITDRMQSKESDDSFCAVIFKYVDLFKKNKNDLIESLAAQTKLKLKKREV